MSKVCYVTAYLDIGRGDWVNFKRDFDTYLEHFTPYIKLFDDNKNENVEMIVYIDEKYYERLNKLIRSDIPIRLIKINEKFLIKNSEIWNHLQKEIEILDSKEYKTRFKHRLKFPENNNAKYTLVNHIKIDYIVYSMGLSQANYFCWTDFGYFQNKNRIPSKLIDINKLDLDKVNFTLINPLTEHDKNILYTMDYAPERFGGFFFFGNRDILKKYRDLYSKVHLYFQKNNLVDDDQHLSLRCYFLKPDMFKLHMLGGWHKALIYFQ